MFAAPPVAVVVAPKDPAAPEAVAPALAPVGSKGLAFGTFGTGLDAAACCICMGDMGADCEGVIKDSAAGPCEFSVVLLRSQGLGVDIDLINLLSL